MTKWLDWIALLSLLLTPAAATPAIQHVSDGEIALAAAEHDLCGKEVVLLGENDFHGDGSAIAFKTDLVRRLVGHCRFNAIFFEASHYDFLAFSYRLRNRAPVSSDMVSSALGWIWNHDAEVAPLIPFLFDEAKAGRLTLGGLDDQLGGRGMFYSIDRMPAELTAYLPAARGADCRERLRQKIWSDYPAGTPHDEASRGRLQQCLGGIATALGAEKDRAKREFLLELVANARRDVARDFATPPQYAQGRDHSMYLNLRWLAARLPRRSKIIVWAENAHIARDPIGHPEFAGRNLGWYVHQTYGARAFALGFSSASGAFRYSAHRNPTIPAAPADSLEARVFAGNDRQTVYLDHARLAAMGAVPGGFFDHRPVAADWSRIVDGLVVFRTEHPVTRTDE